MSELVVTDEEIANFDTVSFREKLKHNNKTILRPEILEAYAGLILGEFKSAVWRGYSINYSDIIIRYFDYSEPDKTKKIKELYLRAGVSDFTTEKLKDGSTKKNHKPNFANWLDLMDEAFVPLFIWISKKKNAYYE